MATARRGVPRLAVRPDVGEPGVKRPEPAFVNIPGRPPVAEKQSERLRVTGQDRDVHVVVFPTDAREGLDAPPTNDPPRTVESGHERGDGCGFQWVPPAVPAVEFLGRQVTDRGRLCCRRLSRWQHENGTLQQKPLPESRHALSGISAHGAHAHPSGPLRYLCWSSGRRSRVPTGSRVERLRAVPNRRRARCPSCSVRGGY